MAVFTPKKRAVRDSIANSSSRALETRIREDTFLILARVAGIDTERKLATISRNRGMIVESNVLYTSPAPSVDDIVVVARLGGYEQSTSIIIGKIEVPDETS